MTLFYSVGHHTLPSMGGTRRSWQESDGRPSDCSLLAVVWHRATDECEMEEWLTGQQPLLSGNLSQHYVHLKKPARKRKAGTELQSEMNTGVETRDCSKWRRNSRLSSLSYSSNLIFQTWNSQREQIWPPSMNLGFEVFLLSYPWALKFRILSFPWGPWWGKGLPLQG